NFLSYIGSPTAIRSGTNIATTPVGAGPFILKSWQRDSQMEMVRNPSYWNAPLPYVDRVLFKFIADPTQRCNAIAGGEGDRSQVTDNSCNDAAKKAGLQVNFLQLGNQGLDFNMTKPPFNDPRMRQAMTLAVDRDAMAQTLDGDTSLALRTFFSPG